MVDLGGLARLDREAGGGSGPKLLALRDRHVEHELAGGEGRDLEPALGVGRHVRFARRSKEVRSSGRRSALHATLDRFLRHHSNLQSLHIGWVARLHLHLQASNGVESEVVNPSFRSADLLELKTKPGGFDSDSVKIVDPGALDLSLAAAIGRGRDQPTQFVRQWSVRPGADASDHSQQGWHHPGAPRPAADPAPAREPLCAPVRSASVAPIPRPESLSATTPAPRALRSGSRPIVPVADSLVPVPSQRELRSGRCHHGLTSHVPERADPRLTFPIRKGTP